MFGAQNVQVENPSWMAGGVEVMTGIVLPWSRIVIAVFAGAVLLAIWLVLTRTRLGLFVRSVTQNRAMAGALGVPTARVDMLAFGLGSGLAGLAGCALSQIGNVGPDLGQSYIVGSFMVVVLGGVVGWREPGVGGAHLGIVNKFLERGRCGAARSPCSCSSSCSSKRPQGCFAFRGRTVEATPVDAIQFDKGQPSAHRRTAARRPACGAAGARPSCTRTDGAGGRRAAAAAMDAHSAAAFACSSRFRRQPACPDGVLTCPTTPSRSAAKIACYAIVALAMDLSGATASCRSAMASFSRSAAARGHGRCARSAPKASITASCPASSFLDWKAYPWYWRYTDHFWYAAMLVVLVPGILACVFGYFAFRSRIKGVYFSIITQALTYAAMLLFFRNDTGFGGNNGFTDFKRILGYPITAPTTRIVLFCVTAATLLAGIAVCRVLVASKLGRVLTAIRDAESRVMFSGYNPVHFKLFVWTLSAIMCGIAGAL